MVLHGGLAHGVGWPTFDIGLTAGRESQRESFSFFGQGRHRVRENNVKKIWDAGEAPWKTWE